MSRAEAATVGNGDKDIYWDGIARSYIPPAELDIPRSLKLHTEWSDDIDPITYEVVRYSLMNANLEHSSLLTRLCVSPVVMLAKDCQSSVLMETGDLVFLAPNLQYFSNAHSLAIKWTLENRVESPGIGADDMFLSNDVFVGAPHQPDTCVAAPVFLGDELFCWVANSLHHSDVGGPVPGSHCIDAHNSWEEALNWPPIKIVAAGKLQADVLDLFARQSRVPVGVKMDLHASIAANEATKAKVLELVRRYGPETVKGAMRRTTDAGEALFVQRLASIPDGKWSHRAYSEAIVRGDRSVFGYQVNITKVGDRLIVDNEGTSPQAGSVNVTFAAFSGAVLAALTQQMTSDLAGAYGGVYRRVEFQPISGLMNCGEFPAAVSPSGSTTTEMQLNIASTAIGKMLACGDAATWELILGPCVPHMYSQVANGTADDGTFFVFPNTDCLMGSLAGRPSRDGVDVGGQWWVPDAIVANVEEFEAAMPMLCLYRRLLPIGLDGAGRHRAGLGYVESFIPMGAKSINIDMHMGESFPKGQGLFGGNPTSRATFRVAEGASVLDLLRRGGRVSRFDELGGVDKPLNFKGEPVTVHDGEPWEASSPTAPGYGDPLLRLPQAVAADVTTRLLTPDAACRVYGVVLNENGSVDVEASTEARREIRRERLEGAEPREPVQPPPTAVQVGDLLHVVDGRWWCNGADLGAVEENYKRAAAMRVRPTWELGPEYEYHDREMAETVVFREFLCPVTGLRIDTEIALPESEPIHDIQVTANAFAASREVEPREVN